MEIKECLRTIGCLIIIICTSFISGCDELGSGTKVADMSKGSLTSGHSRTKPIKESFRSACHTVSSEKVAEILNWHESQTTSEEVISFEDGRLSVCQFKEQDNGLYLTIKIANKSDIAIRNKALVKEYKSLVETTSHAAQFEEYPTIVGSESLIAQYSLQNNTKIYILRNRFGDYLDTTIKMLSDENDDVLNINRLKSIALLMQ